MVIILIILIIIILFITIFIILINITTIYHQYHQVVLIFIFMFVVGIAIVGFPWVLMGEIEQTKMLFICIFLPAEWFAPELKSVVSGTLMSVQFAGIFIAVKNTITTMIMTITITRCK